MRLQYASCGVAAALMPLSSNINSPSSDPQPARGGAQVCERGRPQHVLLVRSSRGQGLTQYHQVPKAPRAQLQWRCLPVRTKGGASHLTYTRRIQEADASRDAALIAKVHAAINLPLGVDAEDVGMEEAGGDAPPRDALLRGALAA